MKFIKRLYSIVSHRPRVLIVGAGPAGLAAAQALKNKTYHIDIIEKEKSIPLDGAGIAIPANGSWALKKLGIDIEHKALKISRMQFTDEKGHLLVEEKIDALHPKGAQFYSMRRRDLMEILVSKLIGTDTRVYTGVTLDKCYERKNEIIVHFSNRTVKYYDLMIACDGIRSSIRSAAYPTERPEFLGVLSWRTVVHSFPEVKAPVYMLGPDRLVLLYPLPNNQVYVYGHVFQPEKKVISDSFSAVFSKFQGLALQAKKKIEEQNPSFHMAHLEKSDSVRFVAKDFQRILFLGDAAHAFGPLLQNGAAQAFEDAYILQNFSEIYAQSQHVPLLTYGFDLHRRNRVQEIYDASNKGLQSISDPKQIEARLEFIRQNGAPNVNGFKKIFQFNP